MKRFKFLQWLSCVVFKTPIGTIPCRFVRIVKNILFPLHYFYQKQSNIRWDVYSNRYYFAGMEFTAKDLIEFNHWLQKKENSHVV